MFQLFFINLFNDGLFLSGMFIMVALYHIVLYLYRRNDLSILWFGIICIEMSLAALIGGEAPPIEILTQKTHVATDLIIRFIATFIFPVFFALFLKSLFKKDLSTLIVRIYCCICNAIFIIHLIYISFYRFDFIYMLSNGFMILSTAFLVYIIVALTIAAIHKRPDALMFLFSTIFLLIGVVFDTLDHLNIYSLFQTDITVPFFAIFTIIVQTIMLSNRFARIESEIIRAGHLTLLGELSAGVAHEITTPINAIINFAQIQIDSVKKGQFNPEFSNHIVNEGRRIDHIVKSLLLFGKAGKKEKRPERLINVINDTLVLTNMQLRKDNITIIVDVSEKLPLVIMNFQEMQQVFMNLINNSRYALNVKFGKEPHPNKKIEITGKILEDINRLQIVFRDNGCGIPVKNLGKIGDPFFTTKPDGQGTGLGMSLSYGIITNFGGSLKIKSTVNEYTKIIIELPYDCGCKLPDVAKSECCHTVDMSAINQRIMTVNKMLKMDIP